MPPTVDFFVSSQGAGVVLASSQIWANVTPVGMTTRMGDEITSADSPLPRLP
jgi:hypothetical protein